MRILAQLVEHVKESCIRFVQQTNLQMAHGVTGSSPVYPPPVFMPTPVDTKQLQTRVLNTSLRRPGIFFAR